jgi:hypothetical protein
MMNYPRLRKALIINNIKFDNHSSDLYILDNKANRELLEECGYIIKDVFSACALPFISMNNTPMIEIMFMYDKDLFNENNRLGAEL